MEVEHILEEGEEVVVICPRCDGEGKIWNILNQFMKECPTCEGEGKIEAELAESPLLSPKSTNTKQHRR